MNDCNEVSFLILISFYLSFRASLHEQREAYMIPFMFISMHVYVDRVCLQNMYSQTSIVRNASDFQLFFELSEFRTYRVGFFRIVGNIRACKMTACSGRMCEITSYEVFTCSTKREGMTAIIVTKII